MEEYRREILLNKITFPNSAASIHDMATDNMGKCLCKIESIKIPKYLMPNFDQIAICLSNADSAETVCKKDGVCHVTMAISDYMFVSTGNLYVYDGRESNRTFIWKNYGKESIIIAYYDFEGNEYFLPPDCGIRLKLCFHRL